MNNKLHTILGANGIIGRNIINILNQKGIQTRAIVRSNKYYDDDYMIADAMDYKQLDKAISGTNYVYLCIGINYSYKSWKEQWEIIMTNTINACNKHNAKLIFLDNVYMYGPSPLPIPFNEKTNIQPISKKGQVRKKIAEIFMNSIESGKINGLIGRAADFYGPSCEYSVLYYTFIQRMNNKKAPQSLFNLNKIHTYAYTEDIANALIELALKDDCYGQIWHLPASKPITINELLDIFNNEYKTNYKISYLPPIFRKILGLFFMPAIRELDEMMYQFDNEYIISFDKFMKRFPNFQVTDYNFGVKKMIESFKK